MPVQEGQYVVEHTVALRRRFRRVSCAQYVMRRTILTLFYLAKFTVHAQGFNDNEEDLFCVNLRLIL